MRRGTKHKVGLAALALIAVAGLAWLSIRPSADRDWKPEHARVPVVEFRGDTVRVDNVRDFDWRSLDDFDARYESRVYDLDRLDRLWFGLAVFHPDGWRGPAHSLLSFGFDDGTTVAISVEARKEVGESYSVYRGLAKRFELLYVVGEERDLIGNRAMFRDDQLFLYPIRADRDKIRAIFVDMLRAAARLGEHPEFYNTLTNNCTTRLRDHVNRVVPGRIPPSWKVLLPGYADEFLASLDLLDTDQPLAAARTQFDIKAQARAAYATEDFSGALRRGQPVLMR